MIYHTTGRLCIDWAGEIEYHKKGSAGNLLDKLRLKGKPLNPPKMISGACGEPIEQPSLATLQKTFHGNSVSDAEADQLIQDALFPLRAEDPDEVLTVLYRMHTCSGVSNIVEKTTRKAYNANEALKQEKTWAHKNLTLVGSGQVVIEAWDTNSCTPVRGCYIIDVEDLEEKHTVIGHHHDYEKPEEPPTTIEIENIPNHTCGWGSRSAC